MKMQCTVKACMAGMILLILSGCKEEEYRLRFSHYMHVEDMGMTCADCHGEPGEGFKAISHKSCSDCHMEIEEEEITEKTCGICHQKEQLPELKGMEAVPAPLGSSVFVHTEALTDRCAECHGDVLTEGQQRTPLLTRSDVLAIRREAHRSGESCVNCHVDMAADQAPVDHDRFWVKRHGMQGSQPDASCSVCHSEDSCRECHSVMEPASHNNLWRLRTHGAVASWDRQSCAVCHEEDSCVSCHSQTRPRSHNARWSENHCYGCHTGTPANEGCVVCHQEGNNVLLHQEFWPPVHDRLGNQANCYACHNPYED